MVPVGNGGEFVIITSYYGYSSANSDPTLARLNERLLKIVLACAATFVEIP